LKGKKTCPICRYDFGDDTNSDKILEKNFQIVDIEIIKDEKKRILKEIFDTLDPFFIMPEFGLIN